MNIDKDNKPNSRKIQAENRRLQILNTALSVFAEKGFAKSTIKDIAEAAGISSGLMYHYFPGKERLLEAAVTHHNFLPQMREILRDTEGKSCREVLSKMAHRFVELLEQKNEIVTIFLRESASNTSVRKVQVRLASEGILLLREYIAGRITAGELREHNVEATARCMLFSLIMLHFTKDIFTSTKVERSRLIDETVDIIINGIRKVEI